MNKPSPNFDSLSPNEAKELKIASHSTSQSGKNTIVVELECSTPVVTMTLESADKITVYYQHLYGYKIPIGMSGIALNGEFETMCCPSHPYPSCATSYSSKEDFYPESEGSGTEGSGTFLGIDDSATEDIKLL